jgi:uncharacterized protein YjbJ (UPF0337 family)
MYQRVLFCANLLGFDLVWKNNRERSPTMAGKMDQAKGRLKEAGGALTGNERLKQEGKMDQAAGKMKGAATKVVNAVKNALSGSKSRRSAR